MERAEQGSDSHRHAAADLSRAFVQKHIIGHKDKVHTLCNLLHMMNIANEEEIQRRIVLKCNLNSACVLISQDVKLYTAYSLVHVLRLHAPDSPYSLVEQQVCLPPTPVQCILPVHICNMMKKELEHHFCYSRGRSIG